MYGIEIYDTLFINNTAHNGGAIQVDRGFYYLQNVTFLNNIAKSNGGAINDVMGVDACRNAYNISHIAYIGPGTVFKQNKAKYGGAVYSTNCAFAFSSPYYSQRIVFENNTAIVSGGAIFLDNHDHDLLSVVVSDCNFINNSAASGGAVTVSGGNTIILNSVFLSNEASEGIGGGLLVQSMELFVSWIVFLLLQDSLFLYNHAQYGGAIAINTLGEQYSLSDAMLIWNTTVQHNYASISGGGIYIQLGFLDSYYSMISNNIAAVNGGGLYLELGGFYSTKCVYNGNLAEYGAGLFTYSTFVILESDIIRNGVAKTYGGGIYWIHCPNINLYNYFNVTNITYLTNNTAGISGGAYFIDHLHNDSCFWTEYELIELENNMAPFGSDKSIYGWYMEVDFSIPSVTKGTIIDVDVVIYDNFGNLVTIAPIDTPLIFSIILVSIEPFEWTELFISPMINKGLIRLEFEIALSSNSTYYGKDVSVPIEFIISPNLPECDCNKSIQTLYISEQQKLSISMKYILYCLG
eukprot:94435_1